ncbi:MAG: hydroxyacid dehydrogenase [Sphaerochaetaceae bacterium]|nr:hydroxyacid dehydrogenase [Sphaerochaetaceae bacterium]
MNEVKQSVALIDSFPCVDEAKVDVLLKAEIDLDKSKIIVLDDDPTGVQTVHDISVYTDWSCESIEDGFNDKNKVFFILTNSRGFTQKETIKVHTEIAKNIASVAKRLGRQFVIVSRSDSTLRGHYPVETEVLKSVLEDEGLASFDAEVLCPYFREGGRFTIGNVHYVKEGAYLTPAGQTEFAKDKTFGYCASNMCEYVEEKTQGSYKACDVVCISLDDIRALNIDKITKQLMGVSGFNKIVVNAVSDVDVKVFCIALYRAMKSGKRFMMRTAASIVKVMGGISNQPLLTREQMICNNTTAGGIIVVGSHTAKTTAQLEALKGLKDVEFCLFDSDLVLDEAKFEKEKARVQSWVDGVISSGKTAVVYTKRKLLVVENDTKEEALIRSVKISNAVQSFVANLKEAPAFVMAKGGITSSDIGTKALKVKRANVLGQIQPSVPVWQLGVESRFPGTPFVIFPGNTGDETTLRSAAAILMGCEMFELDKN